MAQLNVRLSDPLYKEIQNILKSELNTDTSEFVRALFIDMILIYRDAKRGTKVLNEAGERHRIDSRPGTVLMLARDWRDRQDMAILAREEAELRRNDPSSQDEGQF